MKRRAFIKYMGQSSLLAFGGLLATRFAAGQTYDEAESCALEYSYDDLAGCVMESNGYKSYGYYQGLGPSERRSSSRSDGTYYKMPCIPQEDIDAGESRTYEFWHGHNGQVHQFTVTAEDFAQLQEGRDIEIYTDVITGHRHALLVSPKKTCE